MFNFCFILSTSNDKLISTGARAGLGRTWSVPENLNIGQVAPETQSSVAEEAAGPEDEPGSEEAGRNVAAEPAGIEAADPPASEVAKPHPMKADGNRWSGATRHGRTGRDIWPNSCKQSLYLITEIMAGSIVLCHARTKEALHAHPRVHLRGCQERVLVEKHLHQGNQLDGP